jgi:hypothetical protein
MNEIIFQFSSIYSTGRRRRKASKQASQPHFQKEQRLHSHFAPLFAKAKDATEAEHGAHLTKHDSISLLPHA